MWYITEKKSIIAYNVYVKYTLYQVDIELNCVLRTKVF